MDDALDSPSSVNLIIRDFPATDHARLKSQAARERTTLQQLCRSLLSQAARKTPDDGVAPAGAEDPMLVTEAEMRWHLAAVARSVAVRIGAVPENEAGLLSPEETRDVIEDNDPNTYLAMAQHLNAYAAWWHHHRWLSETGRAGKLNEDERAILRQHIEQRENTRQILLSRVKSVELERQTKNRRRSSLRGDFDKEHVEAIDAVSDRIRNSGDVLQTHGIDGWVITCGKMQRGSESGYGCTFDPPSGYEDFFFQHPQSAAKAFVDAVGANAAWVALNES